jgi:hydroxyacylglutathione hydrolase
MSVRVIAVPCLRDNYAYLVAETGANRALVIDPSEAEPVEAALVREGLQLAAVLCTHHHWDHVGGNEALCARRPALPVYAHNSDQGRVPRQTHAVDEGVAFEAAGLSISPLHVPGHTLGAVAYSIDDAVFTGDTLFVAGCGRLFEGTPEMMHASLSKLAALRDDARVFCGHEYTAKNLEFALHAEPRNGAASAKLAWARAEREAGRPTVPSTIADELATNPFLRCSEPALIERFGGASAADVLGRVRAAKDAF